jgi:DNA-binding CsgD family transcriptional regulator
MTNQIKEEHKVMVQLLSEGKAYKEIAKEMKCKKSELTNWLHRLRASLNCKSSSHLVAYFLRNGIIK